MPDVLRASGSYSVDYRGRPTDTQNVNYWHQRFFETLDVSSLNLHSSSVMGEARRLGKDVHIYNQGRSRYSFGLYQWSEFRKGVRARWQWHLNVLHGYQFFDLDGREPDTAMICYGRECIYPTIHFERAREGAEDFYLYETLRKREPDKMAMLYEWAARIRLNQRHAPAAYDPAAIKARVVAALEGK